MGPLDLNDPPTENLTVTKEYLHELYDEIDVLKDALELLTPEQRAKIWEIKSRPNWKPNNGRAQIGEGLGETLSARELEVMQLIAEGGETPQLAVKLHISRHTVNDHANNVLHKLGASTRAQAVWMLQGRLRPYQGE